MAAISLSDDMKQYVSATMRSRGVDGEAATELWGLVADCVLSQVFPSMDARHRILGAALVTPSSTTISANADQFARQILEYFDGLNVLVCGVVHDEGSKSTKNFVTGQVTVIEARQRLRSRTLGHCFVGKGGEDNGEGLQKLLELSRLKCVPVAIVVSDRGGNKVGAYLKNGTEYAAQFQAPCGLHSLNLYGELSKPAFGMVEKKIQHLPELLYWSATFMREK